MRPPEAWRAFKHNPQRPGNAAGRERDSAGALAAAAALPRLLWVAEVSALLTAAVALAVAVVAVRVVVVSVVTMMFMVGVAVGPDECVEEAHESSWVGMPS